MRNTSSYIWNFNSKNNIALGRYPVACCGEYSFAIIVLLVIIIIGISYAWLRTVKYGDKDVKITVGDFDLVLNEPGDGISLITNDHTVHGH